MHKHLPPLSLILITFVLFLPVCWNEFVLWDDNVNIYQNVYLNPPTYENLARFWSEPFESLYIPLTYTVWTFAAFLSQYLYSEMASLESSVFHSMNCFVHLINFFLVFFIIKFLITKNIEQVADRPSSPNNSMSSWAAALGALFYSIHPVQVEVVSWATGMKDLLYTMFALAAILQYLQIGSAKVARMDGLNGQKQQGAKQYILLPVLASLSYLCALLSKPTAVVVPVIAFVLSHWLLRHPLKKKGYLLIVWLIVALVWALKTKSYQPDSRLNFMLPSLWERLLVAGDTIAFYLFKLFFPVELIIDYSRFPGYVLLQKWIYWTSIIPTILLVATYWIKKNRIWSAGVVVFFVGIAPVSGIVPFEFQNYSTVADRYIYFAMLGPSLIVGWVLATYPKKWVLLVSSVLLSLLIGQSFFQIQYWKNSEALFTHTLSVNPFSYRIHNNLAITLSKKNRNIEAIKHYKKALLINPNYGSSHFNLGKLLIKKGKYSKAEDHFNAVLRMNPYDIGALFSLAAALKELGRNHEALKHLERLLSIQPKYVGAHNLTGLVFASLGRNKEAIVSYREALRLFSENPEAHNNLGIAHSAEGDWELSEKEYKRAIELESEYVDPHNNLAIGYLDRGFFDKALIHVNEALKINPRSADALNSKGEYYLKTGKYEKALQEFKGSLAVEPAPFRYWNAALAAEKMGEIKEATLYWREFLKWNTGVQDREIVQNHLRDLEGKQ